MFTFYYILINIFYHINTLCLLFLSINDIFPLNIDITLRINDIFPLNIDITFRINYIFFSHKSVPFTFSVHSNNNSPKYMIKILLDSVKKKAVNSST